MLRSAASKGIFALLLSLATMAGQFLVRTQMTTSLGATKEYDVFLLMLIPATLLAQVGYQAVASALMPRLCDLIAEGNGVAARLRFTSILSTVNAVLFASLMLLIGGLWISGWEGTQLLSLVVVLLGWGIAGGWLVLERQFLVYRGRFVAASVLTMIPAYILAATGLIPGAGLEHFLASGLLGWTFAAVAAALINQGEWIRLGVMQKAAFLPDWQVLRASWPDLRGAVPILLASANAQAMSAIDQTMAAGWAAGGLVLLGTALAVGRLPHAVADNLMQSLGYRRVLESVAAFRRAAGPREATELRQCFTRLGFIQLAILIPAGLFVMLFARDVVALLFERGAFDASSADGAAAVLAFVPLCAPALALQAVQVQFLVAWDRAAAALKVEVFLTLLSAGLNLLFLPVLGLPGLILSTALSTSLVAVVLFRVLGRIAAPLNGRLLIDALAEHFPAACGALAVGLLFRQLEATEQLPLVVKVLGGGALMAACHYSILLMPSRARRTGGSRLLPRGFRPTTG